MKGSPLQEQCRDRLILEAKRSISDLGPKSGLIPNFAVGCKRLISTGHAYLQVGPISPEPKAGLVVISIDARKALKEANVRAVYAGVSAFTENGCLSEGGEHHSGDVAILATGFDTSYVPGYPIHAHGRNLQDVWSSRLEGYLGLGIPGFPNTFTMLGPYSPVSNGPLLPAIEAQADYVCSFVDRWQTEPSIRSFTLKREAAADFTSHVSDMMPQFVWTEGCRNSHNNHTPGSRVPTTWPGSTLHYIEAVREVRYDDWDVVHDGNRFSFLGTGISQAESDPTSDLAYYIRTTDDGVHGSRLKRNLAIAKTGSQPLRELHSLDKLRAGRSGPQRHGEGPQEAIATTCSPRESTHATGMKPRG